MFGTAQLLAKVDGTFTSGQRPPSRFEFYTNVANGAQTLRWGIDNAGRLFAGGQSASFPALINSGAEMQAILADGSAYAAFRASLLTLGTSPASVGTVRLPTPSSGTASIGTPNAQEFKGVTKSLTDNTLTNLFVIDNDTDGEISGGTINYVVTVDNGSEMQVESGVAVFCVTNNGGSQNGTIAKIGSTSYQTTGTLSVTFAEADDAPGRLIQVTADSSLNFSATITYSITNLSARAVTLQ